MRRGFPGAVRVEVTYRLIDNQLTIAYKAAAEQSTVVNLTNHTYFNLGGHSSGTVEDHVPTLRASRYTPMDSGNIPWGRWRRWRERRWISGHLRHLGAVSTIKPLTAGGDMTTTMRWTAEKARWRSCGAPATGIGLEMTTSMEGMQLYTAGWLTERGEKTARSTVRPTVSVWRHSIFPNAVNCPAFPSPILRKGETLQQWTAFRFFAR